MSTSMTLSALRTATRQRADMVNSTYVTDAELNSYINQSYFELYDLLITVYEDYYVKAPLIFPTDGNSQYDLPSDFYKLLGVDIGVAGGGNAWVNVRKFDFIERNNYVYPQITSTALGWFNLRYRLVGDTLMFIPSPSSGQYIRLWYIPTLITLSTDASTVDGVSGWTEYIICDAAIKCGQKEESDVSVLMAQKGALIKRIEDSAMNRDAGMPDTISNTRRSSLYGIGPNGDGQYGGF